MQWGFQIPRTIYPNILLFLKYLFDYPILGLLIVLLISAFATTHRLKVEYLYTCFLNYKSFYISWWFFLILNRYFMKYRWENHNVNSTFLQIKNAFDFYLCISRISSIPIHFARTWGHLLDIGETRSTIFNGIIQVNLLILHLRRVKSIGVYNMFKLLISLTSFSERQQKKKNRVTNKLSP